MQHKYVDPFIYSKRVHIRNHSCVSTKLKEKYYFYIVGFLHFLHTTVTNKIMFTTEFHVSLNQYGWACFVLAQS